MDTDKNGWKPAKMERSSKDRLKKRNLSSKAETLHRMEIPIKERACIDVLKAVFTLMVLFVHSYQEQIYLGSGTVAYAGPAWWKACKWMLSCGICDIAVSGFFMLLAYLLYYKGYGYAENLKKKAKTLLVPYIILNTFWIIFFGAAQAVPVLRVYFTSGGFRIAGWGAWEWLDAYTGAVSGSPILYPLWFVMNLLALNILAPLFEILTKRIPYLASFASLACWLLVGSTGVFCLRVTAVCAWELGCLMAHARKTQPGQNEETPCLYPYTSRTKAERPGRPGQKGKTTCRAKWQTWAVCYGISLIADVLLSVCPTAAALPIVLTAVLPAALPVQRIVHRASVLLGLAFCVSLAGHVDAGRLLEKSRLLRLVSKYSFGIYIFHEMTMSILQKICAKLLPSGLPWQIGQYFAIPFIVLTFCLLFCYTLETYAGGFMPSLPAAGKQKRTRSSTPSGPRTAHPFPVRPVSKTNM